MVINSLIFNNFIILVMIKATPDINNLYGCMFAGDQKVKSMGNETIFLVGETRVGKSTLFSYLLGIRLAAKEQQDGTTVYVPDFESVQIGSGFSSVTLLPNSSSTVKFEDKTTNISLYDMAGFNDEGRSYVGVFGVSYMLKVAFKQAVKVKFLLVIVHSRLMLDQISQMIEPFQSFLNILKSTSIIGKEDLLDKIMNSVSLVISKAERKAPTYLKRLAKIIENYQSKTEKLSNHETLVLKLIKSIHDNNRIEVFKLADIDDQYSDKCRILENLSKPETKWDYFNFKTQIPYDEIIQLPFKQDFARMGANDVKKYNEAEENKLNCIENSYILLTKFLKKAVNNWYQKQKIDYSEQFAELRKITAANNPYKDLELMIEYLNATYEKNGNANTKGVVKLELLEYLSKISSVLTIISNETSRGIQNNEKLKRIEEPCRKLFQLCKNIVCHTQEEETDFFIFTFINIRSLYECAIMIEIDGKKGSGSIFKITDHINLMLPKSIEELKADFTANFIPDEENIDDFENMVSGSIDQVIKKITDPVQAQNMYKAQIKNKLKKGEINFNKGEYQTAAKNFIEANKALDKLVRSHENSETDEKFLDFAEYRLIEIYQKIGFCLEKLNFYSLALRIYEYINSVHLSIQCYEKYIQNSKSFEGKHDTMVQFAHFCKDHGRLNRAIELYQQILDTFICKPKKRKFLMIQLEEMLSSNNTQYIEGYRLVLGEKKRVQNNAQIINEIQSELDLWEGDEQSNNIFEDPDALFEKQYAVKVVEESMIEPPA